MRNTVISFITWLRKCGLKQNNIDGAYALLQKAAKYTSGNMPTAKQSFSATWQKLHFPKKLYRAAYNFYDSLNLNDTSLHDVAQISKRKDMLGNLATNIEIIERQDSLQKIAAMPEDERKDFVKKLVKQTT